MPFKEFDISGIGKAKIYKRRNSRSLKLTVPGAGIVHVTIPYWASYKSGLRFILSKREWILAQRPPFNETLTHGQKIGKSHQIVFRPQAAPGIKTSVRKEEIVISYCSSYAVTDTSVQIAAQNACWRALRKQAGALFEDRLRQLADMHGFEFRSLRIKRMKSRWGSCDQRANIVLNLFLVQLPWELIDYVMLHELSHTVALNHGPVFWQRFEKVLPDARKRRKAMRAYRPALFIAPYSDSMA